MREPTPIEITVEKWHQHLRGELPGGLDELLHDDVVFLSPIVFSPQEGKEVTKLYLGAAFNTLGGGDGNVVRSSDEPSGGFRYVKEVLAGNHAVLEFETSLAGKYVNGVDIITCDDDSRITEFKVMIRPLQAVNAVHAAMKAMLEAGRPPT
jgi:hypothetical protein